MKKLMILGAGEMQVPIIKKAKLNGLFTIVVDFNPDAPGFALADEKLCISTIDFDKVFEHAMSLQIDGILTTSDYPVNVVAKVSAKLNLPAMSIEVAQVCTNKFLQREFLKKNTIRTPFYKLINSKADLDDDFGYPLIIKPVDSSASRGVKLINSKEELERQYSNTAKYSKDGHVILEEYIEGREFSVETFTQNDITTVVAITEKIIEDEKSGYFVEDCHIIPARITNAEYKAIAETVVNVLTKLKINNAPTHTEVKINDKGVYIIEIACRLGGDFITSHLVPLATGVDMLDNLIKVTLGEPIKVKPTQEKIAFVQFLNRNNYFKCINFINSNRNLIVEQDVKEYKDKPIENSLDRLGYLIIQTENYKEMNLILEEINNLKA